jgi:cyclopropane fatty-acyl-phospholipid synthase-like methyltransferase
MSRGEVGADGHWFEGLADHMGATYLRYAFTKGTEQEVDFLVDALGLERGDRVLDIGCGPGRHALSLARRGIRVHGIDISTTFVDLAAATAAREGLGDFASFERADARTVDLPPIFDAAVCLCQGAFGLMDHLAHDIEILGGLAGALRPGGSFALSAFSAYYAVKYHTEATFDAATGVSTEQTVVHDAAGVALNAELRTGCFTPRELRLMCRQVGLTVDALHSVEPGAYGTQDPTPETPEFLVLGHRW